MLFEVLVELLPEAFAAVCTPIGRLTLKLGSFGRYKGETAWAEALEVLVGLMVCGAALIGAVAWALQGTAD